jgi:WD40 repeat protein
MRLTVCGVRGYVLLHALDSSSNSALMIPPCFCTTVPCHLLLSFSLLSRLLHSLEAHTEPVYSVAFSPDGKLMASGSFDNMLHIWNVADGTLLRSQPADGGIFEVRWSKVGDKVAASTSSKTVMVVDLRR